MTWRQKAAGWLSGHIEKALNRLVKGMRNKWRGFDAGDSDSETKFKTKMEAEFDGKGINVGSNNAEAQEEVNTATDADGNTKTDVNFNEDIDADINGTKAGAKAAGRSALNGNTTKKNKGIKKFFLGSKQGTNIKESLNGIAGSSFAKITGVVTVASNMTCAVMGMVGTVSLAVTAAQALQVITIATNLFESIDKMKAGDGNASPYIDYNNAAAKAVTTEYEVTEPGSVKVEKTDTAVTDVSSETTKITKTESFMDSAATASLYSNTTPDANDPAIKSMNPTSVIDNITKIFGAAGGALAGISLTINSFKTCTVAKAIAGVVDAILDAIPGENIIKWISDAIAGATLSIGLQIAIALVVEAFMPFVTKMLTQNFLSGNFGGGESGAAVLEGAEQTFERVDRNTAFTLSTPKSLAAFRTEQKKVIAENAEYERSQLSPFDTSSPYTFLGSLTTKLTPVRNKLGSTLNTVSGITSLAATSVRSLLPSSSAISTGYEIAELKEYTDKNCLYLSGIGGIVKESGIGCTPSRDSDMSTIDMDPAVVMQELEENFEDNEDKIIIKDGSEMADWIDACVINERTVDSVK